jgi:hypothetical protein
MAIRWLKKVPLHVKSLSPHCVAFSQGFSNAQLMDLMSAEELAQERDVEIRKICESIEALSVMFKELATLVRHSFRVCKGGPHEDISCCPHALAFHTFAVNVAQIANRPVTLSGHRARHHH